MRAKGRAGVAKQGSALILALILLGVLVALAAAATAVVRVRVRSARAEVGAVQRYYLAQAGIRYAESILRQDADATLDSLDEDWAMLGDGGREARPLGEGSFRVQIIDAGSRVDINTAPQEMLIRLPGVDDAIADSILDWREEGSTPRPLGAKEDYYLGLTTPYVPRGALFESVAELLLVKGITPLILYGPPLDPGSGDPVMTDVPLSEMVTTGSEEANVSAEGDARININTATADEMMTGAVGALTPDQADAIVQYRRGGGTFESVADLLDVPGLTVDQVRDLADRVTTSSATTVTGHVNINTASAQVLASVPGLDLDLADTIIATREGTGFESIGELLDTLNEEDFREAAPYLCTRSSLFLVRVMARVPASPGVTAMEALVRRTDTTTTVVRCLKVDRAPGWIAWAWPREATDTESGETTRW